MSKNFILSSHGCACSVVLPVTGYINAAKNI
mgnify:CR=1 FL=1